MTVKATVEHHDGDDHMGAVEGDTAADKQQGNENATVKDKQGEADPLAILEDAMGANVDGSEGG
jgi:hypothetical protein